MPAKREKGRPRRFDRDSVCGRLEALRRIIAWALPKDRWIHMNRPMLSPYDEEENAERRREYAVVLKALSYSELTHQCDPDDPDGIPALLLAWQYREGIHGNLLLKSKAEVGFPSVSINVSQRQFECARQLSLFIVASQGKASEEYLSKLCRRHDLHQSNSDDAEVADF